MHYCFSQKIAYLAKLRKLIIKKEKIAEVSCGRWIPAVMSTISRLSFCATVGFGLKEVGRPSGRLYVQASFLRRPFGTVTNFATVPQLISFSQLILSVVGGANVRPQ